MNPQNLTIKGSTQAEIFKDTVEAMVQKLHSHPAAFWQDTLKKDGPIEIWEIAGERWLFNGNHRYHAAIQAGVEIPDSNIVIVVKTKSTIPTFFFHQITWLPGFK